MYNNTLTKDSLMKRLLLIGICYHNHLINFIPEEEHDIKMDGVLTEEGLLRTSQLFI